MPLRQVHLNLKNIGIEDAKFRHWSVQPHPEHSSRAHRDTIKISRWKVFLVGWCGSAHSKWAPVLWHVPTRKIESALHAHGTSPENFLTPSTSVYEHKHSLLSDAKNGRTKRFRCKFIMQIGVHVTRANWRGMRRQHP